MFIDANTLTSDLMDHDPLALGLAPGQVLVCDLTTIDPHRPVVPPKAARWLRRLPCPAIAVARPGPALTTFDLVVSKEDELDRAVAAVAAKPIASLVLVQTLRATETLPLEAALDVESLAFAALQNGAEFRSWLESHRKNAPPASITPDEPAVLTERDGAIFKITLNRPNVRNEIDATMRDALFTALCEAQADASLAAIEIRGAGDSFSTGGALGEFGQIVNGLAGHAIRCQRLPARLLAGLGGACHVRLQGACVGAGLEMAAFARKVTATPATLFKLPEVSMGLIPGAGGCVSIPRRIGRQKAGWLMLTGQRIGAQTALRWGLIDAIDDG